ncbi:MAG: response regulator [Candidatus Binatia bacterium]
MLVVDDDQDSRDALRDLLEVCGYRVQTAASGTEALALLAKRTPALVLMDLQMPVMDGREALAKIRAGGRHPALPIAIVSGEESHLEGYETFRKPVDSTRLLEFVRRVVGPPALRDRPSSARGPGTSAR